MDYCCRFRSYDERLLLVFRGQMALRDTLYSIENQVRVDLDLRRYSSGLLWEYSRQGEEELDRCSYVLLVYP